MSIKISARDVMKLRQQTDAGMMDCKKALLESEGDMEKAIDILRTKLAVKADKRSARVAADGVVMVMISEDAKRGVMLELNSETDFVAREQKFKDFAQQLTARALETFSLDVNALLEQTVTADSSETFAKARENLVGTVGENIQLRRIVGLEAEYVGCYSHGGRIATLVALSANAPECAKDIAMHIAASNPKAVDESGLDAAFLQKEREIYTLQAKESGKPDNIIEKMVTGRMKKVIAETCLITQPFVKDPDVTIEKLLQSNDAKVTAFYRFELGEGIEKEVVDFAQEVQAQLDDS